jgi:hypothetical protein
MPPSFAYLQTFAQNGEFQMSDVEAGKAGPCPMCESGDEPALSETDWTSLGSRAMSCDDGSAVVFRAAASMNPAGTDARAGLRQ